MNIEGVPGDLNATPLSSLPPPTLQTKSDAPKIDSSAVLNYNDILKNLEVERGRAQARQVEQVAPVQAQYQEPVYTPPPVQPVVYYAPVPSEPSLFVKYKRPLFVAALFFIIFYWARPKMRTYVPSLFTETGKLTTTGILALSATAGISFEAGDKFLLSKFP